MPREFNSFSALLAYLERRKKEATRSRKNAHDYICNFKTIRYELECIYCDEKNLALINSFYQLLEVFKQFPVYAQRILIKKKFLIERLDQLIALKREYGFLTIEFMKEVAQTCKMGSKESTAGVFRDYPFLIRPLMTNADNQRKVTQLKLFYTIINAAPDLGPYLLKNEVLRGEIKNIFELSIVIKKSPQSASILMQDEDIRRLICSAADLKTLVKICSKVAVYAFYEEPMRRLCQKPQDQFDIFCLMSDDDMARSLEYFYNGQGFKSDIFDLFKKAQEQVMTERSLQVLSIVTDYFNQRLQCDKKYEEWTSCATPADLITAFGLRSEYKNSQEENCLPAFPSCHQNRKHSIS